MRGPTTVVAIAAIVLSCACGDDADAATDAGGDGGGGADAGTDAGARPPPEPDAGPDCSARPGADRAAQLLEPGGAWPPEASAPISVEAAASCAPVGDACAIGAPETALRASYRKDFFYGYGPGVSDPTLAFGTHEAPTYPEARIADPVDGGRLQIAAVSAVTGEIPRRASPFSRGVALDVWIDGRPSHELLDEGALDWVHVWPAGLVEGGPVFVSFHTRDPRFDELREVSLRVETDAGVAVDGRFPVAVAPAPLTYVTTDAAHETLFAHVRNDDERPHAITRLLVDGRDVTAAACIADPELSPGEAALLTVPLCRPKRMGDPWTVVVEYEDAPAAVGVGRVLRSHFPIEAWPSSSNCPFPTGRVDVFEEHLRLGFDTFFLRQSIDREGCEGVDGTELVNEIYPARGDLFALATDAVTVRPEGRAALAAHFLGDEVDNASLERLVDEGRMREIADEATARWLEGPTTATYVGGSRSRFMGLFAGTADIQGMDFYTAACAPHVTDGGAHPPLRGPYDYLRAARENHMPNATWLYTQGFSGAWNRGELSLQPDATEIRVQALSVVAAGGKGIMVFQSRVDEAEHYPEAWEELGAVNRDVRALRRFLVTGDPTGQARSEQPAIVELVRAPDALVLVVIGLDTCHGPEDLACVLEPLRHWTLPPQVARVRFAVPDDFAIGDAFELRRGELLPPWPRPVRSGRELTMDVFLDNDLPARLYVFAPDGSARERVEAALDR